MFNKIKYYDIVSGNLHNATPSNETHQLCLFKQRLRYSEY